MSFKKSIKLVAGRTGQEYNQRKTRNGAFWEDRYHATAVSSDRHLIQCIAYIDLNMVRTGVVKHPSEWNFGGYEEILKTKNYVRERRKHKGRVCTLDKRLLSVKQEGAVKNTRAN